MRWGPGQAFGDNVWFPQVQGGGTHWESGRLGPRFQRSLDIHGDSPGEGPIAPQVHKEVTQLPNYVHVLCPIL